MIQLPLTGAQKCAVLLLLLDEPAAAELLQQLASAEVRAVGHAMLSVAEIQPHAIDTVLDDFLLASTATAALGHGGAQVRSVLHRALGRSRADGVLGELGPPVAPRPFAGLDWVQPEALADALAREHPQAAAVVMAHLTPEVAAAVLALLPEVLQPDILYRLARLGPVGSDVIAELEAALEAQLADAPVRPASTTNAGPDFTAKLLNLSADQTRLLAALRDLDPELTSAIADNLFRFEDILRLDSRAVQALIRELDPELLAVALKGASPALRDHIFAAMSARAASQIQDDLAARAPLKLSEVHAAQAEVARAVRALAEAGTIMLPGRGGYV